MPKLAPEWVRTSDPVIRSPARYRWTTAPAQNEASDVIDKNQMKHTGCVYIGEILAGNQVINY